MFHQKVDIWRPIAAHPSYEVSIDGHVRRATLHGYRPIKLRPDSGGHLCFCVYRPGVPKKNVYVHHAVLEAFQGPRPAGLWALHRNDDKNDNAISNLYYGSRSSNEVDARRNGLKRKRMTPAMVRQIRSMHDEGLSINEIARQMGLNRMTVGDVVGRRSWKNLV